MSEKTGNATSSLAQEQRDSLLYDPESRQLRLTTGGREITVAELAPELDVQRIQPDGSEQWALFATADELDVLAKMVTYVLDKVRISEGARNTLQALLPRVEAARDRAREGTG